MGLLEEIVIAGFGHNPEVFANLSGIVSACDDKFVVQSISDLSTLVVRHTAPQPTSHQVVDLDPLWHLLTPSTVWDKKDCF